jgi:hypothetical protein
LSFVGRNDSFVGMNPVSLLAALLLTSSAAAQLRAPEAPPPRAEQRRQARLMDEIEAKLRLPPGAQPLGHYARFYAFDAPGKVIAVYVVPEPRDPPGEKCEEVTVDGKSRPVACPPPHAWPPGVAAGRRRWVRNRREMPWIMDGGCLQISVTYDLKSGKIERATCNGYA